MTSHRPIAVITATPPGFNPGMLASQIAAKWFLARHQLDDGSTYFRVVPMSERVAHLNPDERTACLQRIDDGIDYQVLRHPDQLSDATPLYWGDLLHMRQYLDSIRGFLRATDATPEDLLLLQSSAMEVVQRAVSFGTTFLYHSAGDLVGEGFSHGFLRFVRNAKLVLPRDMVSLAQLAAIMPQAISLPGLDATQLFCSGTDWREAFPEGTDSSIASSDVVLCYFARGVHDVADLRHAITLCSKDFDRPVRWLPWGDRLSFPHVFRYEGQLDLEDAAQGTKPRLSALLEAVASARCILTDTYHVAVIAWSLGTPAMLVRGEHWPNDYNAVIDKRHIFYLQHGLQDMFLTTARDHGALASFIRKAAVIVAEGDVVGWYKSTVSQKVVACEQRLAAALLEGAKSG